jgi:hypothetical protein
MQDSSFPQKYPIRIENLLIQDSNSIRVFWELNLRCNYDCEYCPADVHDNSVPIPNRSFYEKSISNLQRLLKSKDRIHWAFSGGEPLINANIQFIFDSISTDMFNSTSIEICTNLSLPPPRLLKLFENPYKIFGPNLCVVASYHAPYTTPDIFFHKISQLVEEYNAIEFYPVLLLPTEDEEFDKAIDLFEKLKEISKPDLRLIRKDFGSDYLNYNPRQLKYMDEYFLRNSSDRLDSLKIYYSDDTTEIVRSPPSLIKRGMVNFEGWLCEAGYSEIVIDSNFQVFRASCNKDGNSMGLIFDDNITLFDKPEPCNRKACLCTTNICINKNLNTGLP